MTFRVHIKKAIAAVCLVGCVTACKPSDESASEFSVDPGNLQSAQIMQSLREANHHAYSQMVRAFSQEELARALKIVSQSLIGRDPTGDELTKARLGLDEYTEVVNSYFETPAFQNSLLNYYRTLFEMGGTESGVDMDEPANLATYLAVNNLPFTEAVTADYCVGNVGGVLTKKNCSSFDNNASLASQQGAGVITTQAFLRRWSESFNFRRVAKAFKYFSCSEYPDADDTGLSESEVAATVKTFNCTNCEQTCYSCHKSMNPRAALFYVFDRTGKYNPGINNESLGQGQSAAIANVTDSNAISYSRDVVVPGAVSRYHGRKVTKLREYGVLLSQNKKFRDCFAQRMTNLLLNRDPYERLLPEYQNVRDDVQANGFSTKKTLLQVATHPAFIRRLGAP